jgi:hypothetical protein
MPLGDLNLSDVSAQQAQSEPGMAHFSGTGPKGTTCGHCAYWGYKREVGKAGAMRPVDACKLFYQFTGKHGPAIKAALPSCRYFEPTSKPAA